MVATRNCWRARLAALGAALIPVAAAFASAPEAPPADTSSAAQVPVVDVLALELERYRRLTVPVTIGGQGPFRFMIDTGAQATVLSRTLADQLQLFDRQPATLIAMASTRQVEVARVPELVLGSRQFTIASAPLLDAANIGGADGILGLDSLQHARVLFDFENSLLTVTDADSARSDRGFDIVVRARRRLGQLVIHRAEIDGISVAVIVDTGAQGSIGNLELQRRLRRARQQADTVMTDVNGVDVTGQTRLVRQLDLGRARVSNFALTFTDSPSFAGLGLADEPAMILGMAELRLFQRVAIDFATAQVLFDLPAAARLSDSALFGPGNGSRITP